MTFAELFEAFDGSFYNPSATWLHGGPSVLDGEQLKRYGKNHSDMGALFFCKDEPVGRWYAGDYAGSRGKVWIAKLSAPVDSIFDLTNSTHRAKLKASVSKAEFDSVMASKGSSGHMDWSAVDDELFGNMGFRGCVFQERPAGMETGLPRASGMAFLPTAVLSVGMFHAEDVHVTGFVPSEDVFKYYR